MKVVLAPIGTDGDILPAIALAIELRHRKHEAVVAAPMNYAHIAARHGLPFRAIGVDTLDTMRKSFTVASLAREVECSLATLMRAAKDADVVVGSAFQFAAPTVAEHYRARFYLMLSAPMFTRIIQKLRWLVELLPELNRSRQALGLESITDMASHMLNAGTIINASFSAQLEKEAYWPSMVDTGPCLLNEKLKPLSKEILEFCAIGPRPIYIGFGSMVQRDPRATAEVICESLLESRARAIIASGWSGFKKADFSDRCVVVDHASHRLLFDHVTAVIHHGGAGTTAIALLAGVPQGIVPHIADQGYWARLMTSLGIGVMLDNRRALTVDGLSAMVAQLSNETLVRQAKKVSQRVAGVTGVRSTADIVTQEGLS